MKNDYDVIRRPIITEKATLASEVEVKFLKFQQVK